VKRKDLQAFKKQLSQDKAVILQTRSPKMDPSPKTGDAEGGDVCDIASSDRERDLKLRLNEREREKLRAIEEALERIEEGTFGTCEECGCKIPVGRLKIMPFAIVCVECKSREEKKSKLISPASQSSFSGDSSVNGIIRVEDDG
jgi:RNA polymerase-binding protein DksA